LEQSKTQINNLNLGKNNPFETIHCKLISESFITQIKKLRIKYLIIRD